VIEFFHSQGSGFDPQHCREGERERERERDRERERRERF
jgi:hypothetical protein